MKRILVLVLALMLGLTCGWLLGSPRGEVARPGPKEETGAELAELRRERDNLQDRLRRLAPGLVATGSEDGRRQDRLEPIRRVERTENEETGSVRFVVRDGKGDPLAGVTVRALNLDRGYQGEVVTDERGVAELKDVPPAEIFFSVSRGGCLRMFPAQIAAGWLTEIPIEPPGGTAVLHGAVIDKREGPLPGIGVSLYRRVGVCTDQYSMKADEQGRYRFEGLPPGPWTLRAFGQALGKERTPTAEIAVPEAGEMELDLLTGVESLSGRVADARSGTPLAGATVGLEGDPSRSDNRRTTVADATGRYLFLDLAPGSYELVVRCEGYVACRRRDVESRGGEERILPLELQPAAEAVVVARSPDGEPYVGMLHVNFYHPGERWPCQATTGQTTREGELRYRELPPGDYEVRAIAVGREPHLEGKALRRFGAAGENRVEIRLSER
jgi:hypothetical protein